MTLCMHLRTQVYRSFHSKLDGLAEYSRFSFDVTIISKYRRPTYLCLSMGEIFVGNSKPYLYVSSLSLAFFADSTWIYRRKTKKKKKSEIKNQDSIAASLVTHVKLRDLKKISVVGNDCGW